MVALAAAGVAHASPALTVDDFAWQTLTIQNEAGVPASELARAEWAVAEQEAVAAGWWRLPRIRFGPGGWNVYIVSDPSAACMEPAGGCHSTTQATMTEGRQPFAVVGTTALSFVLSHEVLEMMADPMGTGVEICDSAEYAYMIGDQQVADFILPSGLDYAP